MKFLPTIAAFMLLVSSAGAAWTDCVCAVECPTAGGSGTLVALSKDGHGLVISAAHVFEDGNERGISCVFPAIDKKCKARLLGTQKLGDLAALDIENPPEVDLPDAIVAGRKEDGPFLCAGFPYDFRRQLRWTRGDFVRYSDTSDGRMLLTRQQVRSGFSGGGRFNRFGEYVGPITGMTGEDTHSMDDCYGASAEVLLKFVDKYVRVDQ